MELSRKRNYRKKEEGIEQTIATLERYLSEFNNDENQIEKCGWNLKRELEAMIKYRTKGAILRSKSQWYNEGENKTRYFLNLEKRNCKQRTTTHVKVHDNDLICTDTEILKECESFYRDLYSCKVGTDNQGGAFFSPQQETRKVLINDQHLLCEAELRKNECLEALKSMAPDKFTGGTDGFPCELYKVF